MVALVDQDVLIYRTGFSVKDGDFIQAVEKLDEYLQSIYDQIRSENKMLVLSGSTNFRTEVDPNYKISRKDSIKPRHYQALREYAIEQLGAYVSVDCEADDILGRWQSKDTVICSNDKDMLQIPGYHLRFKKNWSQNEIIFVTEEESWFNFFKQCLMGDGVDDIEGLKGIGEVKATKALINKSKHEMLETVREMYKKQFGEDWYSNFDKTARLCWIQRHNAKEYFELL